jgi:predicted ribosomally synthesized peptide with SipW-like signal peptide
MNTKKVILSVSIIAVISVLGFFGTRALFSDRETGTGSEFTMGTLDMDVDGQNGTEVEAFVVDNIGQEGDISGGKTWTINNTGSLPGRLYFKLDNVVNTENGCNEPEGEADTTCDDPGDGQGELGGVITAEVLLDGTQVASSTLETANQSVIGDTWEGLSPVTIPPGGSKTVTMEWATAQEDYGNEIQSDSLTFDTVFDLIQVKSDRPTPAP